MFWVLLKREILAHLITFRFAVPVITCLLLVATTMFIRIDDYEQMRRFSIRLSLQSYRVKPNDPR